MKMKRALHAIVLGLAVAGGADLAAQTAPPKPADPHATHGQGTQPQKPAQEQTAAQKWFSDVELLNQDGEKVRFYTDVLKGKTLVINAFFTTCTRIGRQR